MDFLIFAIAMVVLGVLAYFFVLRKRGYGHSTETPIDPSGVNHVQPDGSIRLNSGTIKTSGSVWLTNDQAMLAEGHGWQRTGAALAGLHELYRDPA